MGELEKLRVEAEKLTGKCFEELDVEFLTDLLLEMSNNFKSSVVRWMAINIYHRLKLFYCENALPKNGWKRMVNHCVRELNYKFKQDPSLKKWLVNNFEDAWEMAKGEYRDSRYEWEDLPELTFKNCPWDLETLLKEL